MLDLTKPSRLIRPFAATVMLCAAVALLGTSRAESASTVEAGAMIASANPLATEAGAQMLRQGGSAIDAAIATQLVLGLVEPQSSGIGGGAFLLHHDPATQKTQAYDGREQAPKAATDDQFLKADGERMKFYDAVVGGLSVGVPGVPRLLEKVHQEHGKLPWARLFEPAIALAEEGFEISPRLAFLIDRDKHLATFPDTRAYFYNGDGSPKAAGTILTNPAYADTLRRMAQEGADAFYEGPIAQAIVKTQGEAAQNPGRMTLADLAAYEAKERENLCRPYKGAKQIYRICGMPPPTSGGLATLQIMGLLEPYNLSQYKPMDPQAVHLITQASRLAFADRNAVVADSDYVTVPLRKMLNSEYLLMRAEDINEQDMGKAEPGLLNQRTAINPTHVEPPSTTHLVVRDHDGRVISMTSSVENAFGSRLMASGFLLNNQLTDFSFRPEIDGKPVANKVEPGKRPRSSMSPTLVFNQDGDFYLAVGSPGGSRIIGYVVKTLVGVLDWNLSPQAAINLPNFTNRNGSTDLENGRGLDRLAQDLEGRGHKVNQRSLNSGLHAIRARKAGSEQAIRLDGGADRRREGVVISVP
ncbi:gamma-glutamyltransferase [Rhodovibrionaceae bacterium A322]